MFRLPARFARTRLLPRALVVVLPALFGLQTAYAQAGPAKALLSLTEKQPAAAQSAPSPTPAPEKPASVDIPLPDVAARSEDLKRMVREISDRLPSTDDLEAVKRTLDERDVQLQAQQREIDAVLAATPSTLELREQENYWRSRQRETADTRRQLLDWANVAQSAIQQLKAQQPQWDATLEENKSTPGLGPTLDVIEQSAANLRKLTAQAVDQLRMIVNLQIRAASQDQVALDILDRVNKARQYQDARLFERDSLPLWQITERHQQGENNEFFVNASTRILGIRAFAGEAKGALAFLLVLLAVSLLAAYRFHLLMRRFKPATAQQEQVLHLAKHWIALGILPPLLCAYLLGPIAPLPLIGLVILISFAPIVILLPPFIAPRFRILLHCLAGVYTLSAFIAWMSFSPAHKREVQFLINSCVFLLFAFLVRPARLPRAADLEQPHNLRLFGIRLAVLILGAALIANLFGYLKLAQFLAILCLYSTFIAISMLTGVRVFTRLLLEGVDMPGAEQFAIVRCYRGPIVRWIPRVLKWTGVLVWLIVTINLLGLSEWVGKQIRAIVDFRIAGGSVGVTLGGVVGFFAILLVGYAISSAFRFLLREELLSRFHMARGLPELIASTLHYLLLLLVFFLAVNTGGVELNKFTVLTGALGVGVGFGLQNIVNNFISGLILQFERPIHVGDVLDVDGTAGKVTRIGIRSSTVKTFQGAEVIIPNANFISGKVINWTLSESQRRVELPVGVAYGTDAKLVCGLLEKAATANESVLTSPAPAVFFKDFGESALNFELQFWVMQESNATKVKSEVALEVMSLLSEAGIEIPFPQRDLRVRAVDASAAATLRSANGSSEYPVHEQPDELERTLLRQPAPGYGAGEK